MLAIQRFKGIELDLRSPARSKSLQRGRKKRLWHSIDNCPWKLRFLFRSSELTSRIPAYDPSHSYRQHSVFIRRMRVVKGESINWRGIKRQKPPSNKYGRSDAGCSKAQMAVIRRHIPKRMTQAYRRELRKKEKEKEVGTVRQNTKKGGLRVSKNTTERILCSNTSQTREKKGKFKSRAIIDQGYQKRDIGS